MNYIVFDVETSGLTPEKHALLQLAAIPVINGVEGEPFVSYCKPHKGAILDPQALDINKITVEQIQTFPEPAEVIRNFIDWIDSQEALFALLGHNVQFDRKFLYSWMCRHGFYGDYVTRFRPNDFCTWKLAKEAFKGKRKRPEKFNLQAICNFFEIPYENGHDALADIRMTYKVYQCLKAMKPDVVVPKVKMSYSEKRKKYLDLSYVMFNPEGDIYINGKATKDPEAMRFISEEIYHLFGS